MSPHRFAGWEPAEHTVHRYDDQGRIVSSTTTRAAEWDDIDRAIMISFFDWRNGLCECGQPLDESLLDLDHPKPYTYQGYYKVCTACEARERAEFEQARRHDKTIDLDTKFLPQRARKWLVRKINKSTPGRR